MSSAMTPVPKDHPLMVAWEAYKLTEDYANSRRWACRGDEYVDGSLWAAFMAGFNSTQSLPIAALAAGERRGIERAAAECERYIAAAEELSSLAHEPEIARQRIVGAAAALSLIRELSPSHVETAEERRDFDQPTEATGDD